MALKLPHIPGAITLLGTGTGIACFMPMAHRSGDAAFIGRTASVVVRALAMLPVAMPAALAARPSAARAAPDIIAACRPRPPSAPAVGQAMLAGT